MDEKKETRLAPECRAEKHAPFFTALKTVAFLVIGVILFGKTQNILAPEWNSWGDYTSHQINSMIKLETKELDALILGSSHAYCGISPMKLYQNFGITSYNLGTSVQTPEISYHLLDAAYKKHSVKTVFWDVSSLFLDERTVSDALMNSYYREVMDSLPWGGAKVRMIADYIQHAWSDGLASAFLPIISFHDNWKNLPEVDFFSQDDFYYTFGQAIFTSWAEPASTMQEDIDYLAETASHYTGKAAERAEGNLIVTEREDPLYAPSILEQNMYYFSKIVELCHEHGSRLVLIKVPTAMSSQWYTGAWTREKAALVSGIAATYQLPFWDFQYDVDSLISFTSDTFDGGKHLNPLGAEKVSAYLGERILTEGLAEPKTDPFFEKQSDKFQKVCTVIKLQASADFREYLTFLKESGEDWTITIAASEDYATGLDETDLALLDELGLELVRQGEFSDSYAAVISAGETVYEAVSDYEIYRGIQLPGATVELISKNEFLQWPGASIQINGQGYALSLRGLNVVVFDCETGLVIDSVVFDTFRSDKPCIRDKDLENQLLRNYISKYCYGRAVS